MRFFAIFCLVSALTMICSVSFAKDICKLVYTVSPTGKEIDITVILPDKNADFKVESSASSLSLVLTEFEGIIVSEKDRVEGFIEKVSLGGADETSGKGREILLHLSGSYWDGIEKEGSSLLLRLRKFSSETGTAPLASEQKYIIGIDDKVLISVYNNPDLTKTVQVGKDGRANIALIGDLDIAGLTVSLLTNRLTELYAKDYIVDPQVTVEVVEYNSQWAYVTGEVMQKRKIPLKGTTTLKDAIAEAGGLTAFAGNEILISRKAVSGGDAQQLRVDRAELEEGTTDIRLVNEDVITVPKIKYVYIQGEVKRNCDLPLEKGMTLLKAISIAQGLTDWADDVVEILRETPQGQIKERYNLKRIMDGKNPDVPLKPGDIIIVKKRFL